MTLRTIIASVVFSVILAVCSLPVSAAFTTVTTAQELEVCLESPATSQCELTQPILFAGNQTQRFLDISPPNNAVTHLRCAPGATIVWDNVDGPPAAPVDVVRILLTGGEHLIVEDCTVESRVNGDSEIGHPTTVQLFYARHMPTALSTVSYVEILGGSYKTAYSGSSTIALGCNCTGPTEWLLSNVVAEGPIALDAKGFTPDGSPLDWMLINTHLITRVQSSGAPRCWKQNGDVRFVSLFGSSCTRGLLQFGGGAGQLHNLDGLLIKDAPIDSSGALIVATTSHGFEGTIDVEGAPGDGDPGDNRSHNLFFATAGLGAVDLEVEFDACHRAFSPDSGMGDFTLDLRPGVVEEHRLYLRGPAGCGNPTEFWNSTTLQTLADSETQGYLLTDGGVSFELVDGVPVPVPEPGSLPMLVTGIAFVIALGRRRAALLQC